MQYKTTALGLLTANDPLCRQLKAERRLLATLHRLSAGLKERHRDWMLTLTDRFPADDPQVTSSRALELAVEELRRRLSPNGSAEDEAVTPAGSDAPGN